MRSIKSGMFPHCVRWLRNAVLLCIAFGLASCGGGSPQGTSQNQFNAVEKSTISPPNVTVISITKVSETRVSRTVYDYVFKVAIKNNSTILQTGVIANLTGVGTGTTIIDGIVQFGDVAAGSTVTPQDTITLRQDRTYPFNQAVLIWSISSTVTSVPGLVLTQAVDVAQGGSIVVQVPGNALNGTVITIPAGALGTSGTDTISIGYSDTLPGPIDPNAVSAGATVASKVIDLSHTSNTQFASVLQVTVPYDTTTVGQNAVPIVVYWDTTLNKYEPVQITGFNPVLGTVTFNTKHFTDFLVLAYIVLANHSASDILQQSLSINFNPNTNGFSVKNFSSQTTVAKGGACYGVTSFAAWFFDSNKGIPLFTDYFGSKSTYISINEIEQDIARELINKTYDDTKFENGVSTWIGELTSTPTITAVELYEALMTTGSPQLLVIEDTQNVKTVYHSILVYGWDAVNGSFLIYDPNYPGMARTIHFDTTTGFSSYASSGYLFTGFYFDAFTTHSSTAIFAANLADANNGWPKKVFNTITDIAPTSYAGSAASAYKVNTYAIDPSGNIVLNGSVAATAITASSSAYFYLNGNFIGAAPVTNGKFSTDNILLFDGVNHPFAIPSGQAITELVIIVAKAGGDGNQYTMSGYAGFLRATVGGGCSGGGNYVSEGGLTWTPNNCGQGATYAAQYPAYHFFTWPEANAYCTGGNFQGQTGWRLPTQTELSALYTSGAINGQGWTLTITWSSTPYRAGTHYGVYLLDGTVAIGFGTYDPRFSYVTCVH